MDSEIFRKLPPTKLFFRCAVPSMVTMAFASLYQIADGLFVGRFVGGDALAAFMVSCVLGFLALYLPKILCVSSLRVLPS